MDFKKSKKYTESYKTKFLNKLNEGKMVDVQEGQDLKVAEVSKELPKNAKIGKDEKQSFEDYKTMYKDVITQKCIEDYGTEMDKQLWEDTAKELYLKSKTYIPTGEEKPEEVLDKKEEGYSNIRQISQAEKILLDIIKSVGDYSLQDVVCETTQTGDIHIMTKDGRDITTVDRSIFAIDGDDTELIDELREDGYWKEDFDESKNLKEDLSDKSKFLIHILNGVISDIQDKYNVTATAEFDTNNTNNVVVTLKGNTLDLIDATSYLSKTIRNDNVDFNFDDTIKDNTVKCTISPKTKMESKVEKNKSIVKESYFVKLFNQYGTDVDTIDVNSEQEAIEVAEEKMREGWRAVVYNANNKEALYDYDPFEGLQENKLQLESRDRVAENLSKFIYDLTTEQDTEAYGETAWSGNQPTKMGNGVTVYEVYKNGKSNYTMDDIKKAVIERFPELDVYGTAYNSILFYKPQKTESKLQEDTVKFTLNTNLNESNIDKYNTIPEIKDRLREINKQLAYIRRRDSVSLSIGTEQEQEELRSEKAKLNGRLRKLRNNAVDMDKMTPEQQKEFKQRLKDLDLLDDDESNLQSAIQSYRNHYIQEFESYTKKEENNTNLEYNYMLLDRLRSDCDYFLGYGNGSERHLWAGNIDEQIAKMKELYNSFTDDQKPEWITMEDIDNYEKKMKEYNKEKKTEVTERDLSKDLFQDEANRRIYNRLINLDVYLEQLKKAIENNDTDSIIANKSKIKSNVAYLIPALNIKGSVNGLTDYLKTTDFDFENNFKETADLLKDLNNEDKKEESAVSDYTLSEIKKIIDSNGNDFTIKIVNSNENVETKTLNIDREDLINIYNVLGGNKDSLQEDQYENERRRGKPSIKKIAETEFYDNQDWYIQHIKDYSDEEDFIKKEIAEIAEEYNLKENTAKQVCKEIYNLAIKN